jgi:hypothetical protein
MNAALQGYLDERNKTRRRADRDRDTKTVPVIETARQNQKAAKELSEESAGDVAQIKKLLAPYAQMRTDDEARLKASQPQPAPYR